VKFLIDMPLSPEMIAWLRSLNHDATHANFIGSSEAADEDIIGEARREGRIVVTADLDFSRILALTQVKGPPLILFRGGNYSNAEMLDLLQKVLTSVDESDLQHSITVVDKNRIRRTRLPLAFPRSRRKRP
jgi:predicted nuclease of predicted toxin-antitoxin system